MGDRRNKNKSFLILESEKENYEQQFSSASIDLSIDDSFLFRAAATKSDDTDRFHLSETNRSSASVTRTTPVSSEIMTQQALRLAEKINDQYLTCKICLV